MQEHFDALTEIVRRCSGALIKTIGDAIMATFAEPCDGARAASEMVEQVARLNEVWKIPDRQVQLKVGLHEGPALAISANDRLDYFGQTINIAARVQGLAQGREICLTESTYQIPGVAAVFDQAGSGDRDAGIGATVDEEDRRAGTAHLDRLVYGEHA